MKRIHCVLTALALSSGAFFVGGAAAQQDTRPQDTGWEAGSRYNRLFNPDTMDRVTGTVSDVLSVQPRSDMSPGVHLVVRTDDGRTVPVHLGPEWYMQAQPMRFSPGDRVQVSGSRISFQGDSVLIASEVAKGDRTMTLRDRDGRPAWGGGQDRPPEPQERGRGGSRREMRGPERENPPERGGGLRRQGPGGGESPGGGR